MESSPCPAPLNPGALVAPFNQRNTVEMTYVTAKMRSENLRQVLLCELGHLETLSCHVRSLNTPRVPWSKEAELSGKACAGTPSQSPS